MYSFAKKILFQLEPETAHKTAVISLQLAYKLGFTHFFPKIISTRPRNIMGLTFANPVGLSAGFDKNAEYVDALAALGFGFIEIGTVTPKPQTGNPQPRLFRIEEKGALINRMGFNNKGVDYVVRQLEKIRYRGILGINIGKNRDTPLENAIDDYLIGFRAFWRYASYLTINISSPNTPGLRDLQQDDLLHGLLSKLKAEQQKILETHKKYVPLVVKISPDLSAEEVYKLAHTLLALKIDGVIATNTSTNREGVENFPHAQETGGLSGTPLQARATTIVTQLHSVLQNQIPIIASGGIMDESSAQEKLHAGADLLQVYTGFIYNGPEVIRRLGML